MARKSGRRGAASLALLGVVTLAPAAVWADSAPPASSATQSDLTQQQLLERLNALQAEVNELKAAQASKGGATTAAAPATSPTVADNSTAEAVQKDAQHHTAASFDALSAVTGYDGRGFVLADET